MFLRNILKMLFLVAIASCDQVKTTHLVSFEMYGVQVAPSTAEGDESPLNQTYTIEEVTFLSEDGTSEKVLVDSSNAASYKIVSRRQVIFSIEADELDGQSFSSVTIKFASDVTGQNYNGDELAMQLTTSSYTLTEDFTVSSSQDSVFSIQVQWANTVSDAVMSEPTIVLAKDE